MATDVFACWLLRRRRAAARGVGQPRRRGEMTSGRGRVLAVSRLVAVGLAVALVASAAVALAVGKVGDALSGLPAAADLSGIDDLSDAVQQEIAFPAPSSPPTAR